MNKYVLTKHRRQMALAYVGLTHTVHKGFKCCAGYQAGNRKQDHESRCWGIWKQTFPVIFSGLEKAIFLRQFSGQCV